MAQLMKGRREHDFFKSAKKLVQQFLITLPSASSLQNPDLLKYETLIIPTLVFGGPLVGFWGWMFVA